MSGNSENKFRYRLHRDGAPIQMRQILSKTGLPMCVNCGKTVPPHERRFAHVTKRAAYFCSGKCRHHFAEYVARDIFAKAEWKEPKKKPKFPIRSISGIPEGAEIGMDGEIYVLRSKQYVSSEVYGGRSIRVVLENGNGTREVVMDSQRRVSDRRQPLSS